MRILQRYLLKEMTVNFVAVTVVLFAILFVNQIGAVLARAAEQQYPRGFVFELIGLGALQNIGLLLPIGLVLGIVLGLGRLYHDSEMTAAQACGIGAWRIHTSAWLLAVPVVALVAWLNFDLAPRAVVRQTQLRSEAVRAGRVAPLEPGTFRSFASGRTVTVVYARGRDASGVLTDVFVRQSRGDVIDTTVARGARYAVSADGQTRTITLMDGERLEGIPGGQRYRILRFEQQVIPVSTPAQKPGALRTDEMSVAQLLASHSASGQAELQWRLGTPIMALVLAVLAVPLAHLRPRQGRYNRVWLAVLVFALYANLASAAQAWLERGVLSPQLGLWWVHLLFLLLALLWMFLPGGWRRLRSRRHA